MVFHEITRDAIQRALEHTREIDERLVDAQETRRILDRLYGYEVSPVLWKKVTQGLSAGRVQSVAMRLVVERERERIAFVRSGTGTSRGSSTRARSRPVSSRSTESASRRAATSTRRASSRGTRSPSWKRKQARALPPARGPSPSPSAQPTRSPTRASPTAPFMTSTLQQEASRKLRYSSQTTMRVAQRLYENGYITYMRTDSTTLSGGGAHRGAQAGRRALRRRVHAGEAAPATAQGQERAGGARGDPSRRRLGSARRSEFEAS